MRNGPTAFIVALIAFTNFYFQGGAVPSGTLPVVAVASANSDKGQSASLGSSSAVSNCDLNMQNAFEDLFGTPIENRDAVLQQAKDHNVKFLIATVPDPVHTHLALEFDRLVEGIQQAAAESDYTFQSLNRPPPWPIHRQDNAFDEVQISEAKTTNPDRYNLTINRGEDSSACPGLLIFRKHDIQKPGESEPDSYLVMLLVGEKPTAGLNTGQFLSALRTVRASDPTGGVIGILGPNFSGSYSSLDRLLTLSGLSPPCSQAAQDLPIFYFVIRSGSTMSNDEINWFRTRNYCRASLMSFFDTVEDHEAAIMQFLCNDRFNRQCEAERIAVLSEDETAYGNLRGFRTNSPGVRVYFPRGIATLRTAYQEEASIVTDPERNRAPRTTLKPDFGTSGQEDDDTVPTYDLKHVPLSQEAVLQEIIRTLKQHRVSFVIIRATDEIDTLFLAEHLRKSYPDGQLIALGADLLARRDTDDNTLRGMLAVSNYPPFQGWVDESQTTDIHRIFADSTQEGEFNAALDLIKETQSLSQDHYAFVRQASGPSYLPAAAYAGFMGPNLDGVSEEGVRQLRPRLWLSAVGRNGYWPLTELRTDTLRVVTPKSESSTGSTPGPCEVVIGSLKEPVACGPNPAEGLEGRENTERIHRGLSVTYPLHKVSDSKHFPVQFPILKLSLDKGYILNGFVMFILTAVSAAFVYCIWQGNVSNTESIISQTLGPLQDPRKWRLLMMGGAALMVAWFVLVMSRLVLGPWCILSAAVIYHAWTLHKESTWETVLWIAGTSAAAVGIYFVIRPMDPVARFMFLYRADHFTSGLSPNLPLFLICGSILWWIWYRLRVRSAFDIRGPLLPRGDGIQIPNHDRFKNAGPARSFRINFIILAAGILLALWFQKLRLHSLEGEKLDLIFNLALCLGLMLLFNSLYSAWVYWQRCQVLLNDLNRTPLRYSFMEISGFEWRRVWGLAGADSAFVWRPMIRAWGALERLNGSLDSTRQSYLARVNEVLRHEAGQLTQQLEPLRKVLGRVEIKQPRDSATRFLRVPIRFREYWVGRATQQMKFNQQFCQRIESCQIQISNLATMVYRCILKEYWQQDPRWVTRCPKTKDNNPVERASNGEKDSTSLITVPAMVQWAEEFVALVYISFIIRTLIRIRWLGMAAMGIYVFLLLAATVYPFEPKGTIHAFFVFVFLAMLGTIGLIYAQMHRDDTLSHLTDTQPGQLGGDYWWRMASFAGVPLFTLITTQVPQLSRTLFFWVKPLLDGIGKG